MMDSPIQNRIGCVFIPVSDMTRARRWYERLLGLPPSPVSHADRIADLPMLGETQLILDSHKPVANSSQGQGNQTARAIQVRRDETMDKQAFLALIQAVVTNNRAGGWRKVQRARAP